MRTQIIAVFLCATTVSAGVFASEVDPSKGCRFNPARAGACYSVAGRVAIYNGTPSIRITPQGNKPALGVAPSEHEIMPPGLKEAVRLDQDAIAQLEVCPVGQGRGSIPLVCIESASNMKTERHNH